MWTLITLDMTEIGLKICNMEKDLSLGTMGKQLTLEGFTKEERMDMASFHGRMALTMKVTSLMDTFKVLGFTTLLI